MCRALVIDDNRQTAEALVQMLKLWNITGQAALSLAAAMFILENATPIQYALFCH